MEIKVGHKKRMELATRKIALVAPRFTAREHNLQVTTEYSSL